ncbi:MAG: hypothetical protein ACKVS8_07790 [Phycisphaerales bacterium]
MFRARTYVVLACAALAWTCASASAQLAIPWHTIDGGGGTSTGGTFSLSGTIGQPDAGGPMTGGTFSLTGGFWAGSAAAPSCPLDYNLDGSLNPDDLGDFITDYYTVPHVPGPGGYAIPCPGNDPPYDDGYKTGFTLDYTGQCSEPFPDNLGDYITAYYQGC